jgi:hypothetical protein
VKGSTEGKRDYVANDSLEEGPFTKKGRMTNPNDSPKLELSGAWEPTDSSRPHPHGEREEARCGFPPGNQTTNA